METYIAAADLDLLEYLVFSEKECHSWMRLLLKARKQFLIDYKVPGTHSPEYYGYKEKALCRAKVTIELRILHENM